MSLLSGNDLKEQQRINDLQQKITREKQKLDKKLTRQKILLGTFYLNILEKDSVTGLRDYTVKNLSEFLTRETDKSLLSDLIISLEDMTLDKEKQTHDDHREE